MTIHIFGDLEGDPLQLRKLISKTLPGDTLISVGDYGLTAEATRYMEKFYSVKILVCLGNKEVWKDKDHFPKAGDIVEVEGLKFGFVPGAASPNGFIHRKRRKHEMPTPVDWLGQEVDIVVSHDRVEYSGLAERDHKLPSKKDRERCIRSRQIVTDAVLSSKASLHVHGHYHVKFQEEVDGITHVCLPEASSLEMLKINK